MENSKNNLNLETIQEESRFKSNELSRDQKSQEQIDKEKDKSDSSIKSDHLNEKINSIMI
jgi:hypothetical protein